MSDKQDMASMPIPELIVAIRSHVKKLDPSQMIVGMVLNTLCFRMEEQQDIINLNATHAAPQSFDSWWSHLGFSHLCGNCEKNAAYEAWIYLTAIITERDDNIKRLAAHAGLLGWQITEGDPDCADECNDSWRSLPPHLQELLNIEQERVDKEHQDDIDAEVEAEKHPHRNAAGNLLI